MTLFRDKVISGLAWSALERSGQVGCAFVVQLILARLLLPRQFGVVAMVAVFIGVSNAVVDSGFANAIIQKPDLREADRSTAFQFNIVVGLLAAVLLWCIAPNIANFYGQFELTAIVHWLSLSLILGSLGGVHNALLTRGMEFRKIALATVPATIFSGIVGVSMAYMGYGVWSLVGQMLTQQGGRSLLLWRQSKWRPQTGFSWQSFRTMFPYGSRLALSGVLEQGFQNIYVLVIGRFFSPVDVAFYQRAKSFQQLPVTTVQSIIGRVLFPVFAGMQNDEARLRQAMCRALQFGALVIFPVMAMMAALASPMVTILIGDKWLPAVAMLKPLCFVGALYPLHAVNLNLLMGLGRSDKYLKLEIIKKMLIAANVIGTYRFGVMPMIYGIIVTSIFGLVINTYYSEKFIGYGLGDQFKDVSRIALLACVILGSEWYLVQSLPWSHWGLLMVGCTTGIVIFIGGLRFLDRALRTEINQVLVRLLPGRLQWLTYLI